MAGIIESMVDGSTRLLRLLSLLQSGAPWSGDELAGRLGVSARTLRADIKRLRSLDYRVEATPGVAGGYRLRAGNRIPPLQLDDEEALAVAVALATASSAGVAGVGETADRAAAKLQQILPHRLRRRLQTLTAAADAVPSAGDLVLPEVLTSVAAAVERHERLRFDYHDRQQRSSRRETEPHRLVHTSGRWYLVGYDLQRQDWRTYRLDRIDPKTPPGPRFEPRELPGPDLATFVTRGRMAAMWNYRAQVIVEAPAATVAERIPNGLWVVQPLDTQRSTLDAGAQTAPLLASYLAALDLDLHVDARHHPELATAMTAIAKRYAAAVQQNRR